MKGPWRKVVQRLSWLCTIPAQGRSFTARLHSILSPHVASFPHRRAMTETAYLPLQKHTSAIAFSPPVTNGGLRHAIFRVNQSHTRW